MQDGQKYLSDLLRSNRTCYQESLRGFNEEFEVCYERLSSLRDRIRSGNNSEGCRIQPPSKIGSKKKKPDEDLEASTVSRKDEKESNTRSSKRLVKSFESNDTINLSLGKEATPFKVPIAPSVSNSKKEQSSITKVSKHAKDFANGNESMRQSLETEDNLPKMSAASSMLREGRKQSLRSYKCSRKLATSNDSFNQTEGRKQSLRSSKCSRKLATSNDNLPKMSAASSMLLDGRKQSLRSYKCSRKLATSNDSFNQTEGRKQPLRSYKCSRKLATSNDSFNQTEELSDSQEQKIAQGREEESFGETASLVNYSSAVREISRGNGSCDVEVSCSKQSIGANSTYILEVPNSKPSIGANSTYTLEKTTSKPSIGANSTYILQVPNSKPSIGANSTFVEEEPKSHIRPISVLKNERETSEGSYRMVQTTPPKNQPLQNPPETCARGKKNFGNTGSQAAVKVARKSLNRAKQTAINRIKKSNSAQKLPYRSKVLQIGLGHYRSASQSDASSLHRLKATGLGNALSHQRIMSPKPRKSKCKDELQMLSARTLKACEDRDKLLQSKMEKVINQESQNHVAIIKHKLEKAALGDTAAEGKRRMERQDEHDWLKMKAQKLQNLENLRNVPKSDFVKMVANQGLSYLAKPLSERNLDNLDMPGPSNAKCHPQLQGVSTNQIFEVASYDLTLNPEDRIPIPSKSESNYGLDDVDSNDSSDDESNPKKVVPRWAKAAFRFPVLQNQYEINLTQMSSFFGSKKSTPDLTKMFTGIDKRRLMRRSSAVWRSPDRKKKLNKEKFDL